MCIRDRPRGSVPPKSKPARFWSTPADPSGSTQSKLKVAWTRYRSMARSHSRRCGIPVRRRARRAGVFTLFKPDSHDNETVSYTHLRAHETVLDLVCRLLLEK